MPTLFFFLFFGNILFSAWMILDILIFEIQKYNYGLILINCLVLAEVFGCDDLSSFQGTGVTI